MATQKSVKQVLDEQKTTIMAMPGVEGLGIGKSRDRPEENCILVYTASSVWPGSLPKEIEGIKIEIRPTAGGFKAF